MRSKKSSNKIQPPIETEPLEIDAIYPMPEDPETREFILAEVKKAIQKMKSEMTEEDRRHAKILQLKFIMDDYAKTNKHKAEYSFSYFLQEYIKRIGKKNKELAEEISIDPTELSQVLNNHRKPTDKLICRLAIHSNHFFSAQVWFKIMEKDRAFELKNNKEIIKREEKYVKARLAPFPKTS